MAREICGDTLRFAAEGNVVVDVEEVEPVRDIGAERSGSLVEFVKELAGLRIGGGALLLVNGPFEGIEDTALDFRIEEHPREHFAITLAEFDLGFEGFGIDLSVLEELLIHRAIENVFPIFARESGATFIENARQHDE